MIRHSVTGGGGLELAVYETGNSEGPAILLIHGFKQCHLCWSRQFDSPLAAEFRLIAMDLRGHGSSAKPLAAENYEDGGLWGADVAAVIEALGLSKPLLAGWSFGGYLIGEYLNADGDVALGAINFIGSVSKIGTPDGETFMGPSLLENMENMMSPDLAANIQATRKFVAACTAQPMPRDEFETALAYNMLVPNEVQMASIARVADLDETLAAVTVPTLVSHGTADALLLPSMAEHIAAQVPNGKLSLYEGVGHSPFYEDAERFNGELAALAREIN